MKVVSERLGHSDPGFTLRQYAHVLPSMQADAVKKLVDSVINFQEKSLTIVDEMRKLSTQNSAEIRDAVEAGKKRIARLSAEAAALPSMVN